MIDKKTIEHIAKLSRLSIKYEETEEFSVQLSKVLSYFEHISKVDTTNVEPLVTPVDIKLVLRPDEIKKEFTAEEIVSNAPDKAGNLFKVPPVV